MKRREITSLLVALPAAGVALRPSGLRAQGETQIETIRSVVATRTWSQEDRVYDRFRWGAFAYESLVRDVGPPNGYEQNSFLSGQLSMLLPESLAQWENREAATAYAARHEAELMDALVSLLTENSDNYEAWLETVGLVVSGAASIAVLSGQVLATVASLARREDDEDGILSRILALDWCFYPFCSSSG